MIENKDILEILKKLTKQYFAGRGIKTPPKWAYCLNYSKVKTSIFTGTREVNNTTAVSHFSCTIVCIQESLCVLIVWCNSIYIKTISTLWKTLEHRLTGSTVFIRKTIICRFCKRALHVSIEYNKLNLYNNLWKLKTQ